MCTLLIIFTRQSKTRSRGCQRRTSGLLLVPLSDLGTFAFILQLCFLISSRAAVRGLTCSVAASNTRPSAPRRWRSSSRSSGSVSSGCGSGTWSGSRIYVGPAGTRRSSCRASAPARRTARSLAPSRPFWRGTASRSDVAECPYLKWLVHSQRCPLYVMFQFIYSLANQIWRKTN